MNKDGGDAEGEQALVKAAADGEGISFGSTFGIPGGGAQGCRPTSPPRRVRRAGRPRASSRRPSSASAPG